MFAATFLSPADNFASRHYKIIQLYVWTRIMPLLSLTSLLVLLEKLVSKHRIMRLCWTKDRSRRTQTQPRQKYERSVVEILKTFIFRRRPPWSHDRKHSSSRHSNHLFVFLHLHPIRINGSNQPCRRYLEPSRISLPRSVCKYTPISLEIKTV